MVISVMDHNDNNVTSVDSITNEWVFQYVYEYFQEALNATRSSSASHSLVSTKSLWVVQSSHGQVLNTLFTFPKYCLLMMPVEYDKDQAVDSTSRRNKGRLVQHILVVKIIFPSKKKVCIVIVKLFPPRPLNWCFLLKKMDSVRDLQKEKEMYCWHVCANWYNIKMFQWCCIFNGKCWN